jgi:hypothetical protein
MNFLNNKKNEFVQIELTEKEFNFLRELSTAILLNCPKEQLQTYTGFSKEEILNFGSQLYDIAEKIGVDL